MAGRDAATAVGLVAHVYEHSAPTAAAATATTDNIAARLVHSCEVGDERTRRNIMNLVSRERLYRKYYCGQTSESELEREQFREAIGANNTRPLFRMYRCDDVRPLTRESLCEHMQDLIRKGYSWTYLASQLQYLRSKYRRDYPIAWTQKQVFMRTLNDCYNEYTQRCPRRLATDEMYSCDGDTCRQMHERCRRFFFSERAEMVPRARNRRTEELANAERCALVRFAYTFLFMYETGKRMSEVCLVDVVGLRRLLCDGVLVIRIPKTEKIGRVALRNMCTDEERERFNAFLRRAIELFADDGPYPCAIPFNQYTQRHRLNDLFERLYKRVQRARNNPNPEKPRGLSFHSLRRFRAAYMFQEGRPLDHIRESLDHAHVGMTNMYINKHLMRSYRNARCSLDVDQPPAGETTAATVDERPDDRREVDRDEYRRRTPI